MILITGISGVGKTYTLEQFVERYPEFVRISASTLLGNRGFETIGIDRDTAGRNQLHLAGILSRLGAEDSGRTLLDGHAAIETSQGLYLVPDSVVRALAPQAIVTLTEDNDNALRERRETKGKPRGTPSIELQDLELQRSEAWGALLAVPFRKVRSGDIDGLAIALQSSGVEL